MIIGIDTGLTGAFAALDLTGRVVVCDSLPVVRDGKTAWIDAGRLHTMLERAIYPTIDEPVAFIERTHAMPKNGCIAAFSQGITLGSTLAAVQGVGASIRLITPASWKRALGLVRPAGAETYDAKAASLDKARLLYPGVKLDRKKDHNLAEALLIAHYGIGTLPRQAAA